MPQTQQVQKIQEVQETQEFQEQTIPTHALGQVQLEILTALNAGQQTVNDICAFTKTTTGRTVSAETTRKSLTRLCKEGLTQKVVSTDCKQQCFVATAAGTTALSIQLTGLANLCAQFLQKEVPIPHDISLSEDEFEEILTLFSDTSEDSTEDARISYTSLKQSLARSDDVETSRIPTLHRHYTVHRYTCDGKPALMIQGQATTAYSAAKEFFGNTVEETRSYYSMDKAGKWVLVSEDDAQTPSTDLPFLEKQLLRLAAV